MNTRKTPIKNLHFKAYHLVKGNPEIFLGVEVIGIFTNDTKLEVLFKPGYVFGRQWLDMSEIDTPFEFVHCDIKYRIAFAKDEQEARAKLL